MGNSIYLDNASTSGYKPSSIIEAMNDYISDGVCVSPHRGGYKQSAKAVSLIEETRARLAELFNINNSTNVSFTLNATHALNIALKGLLHSGEHVIISNFEHNSVIRPLERLKKTINISYDVFESDSNGYFDLDMLEKQIRKSTKLIVMNHASNAIGVISPIEEVGKMAKKYGITFLVDCAQTAGLVDIDVEKSQIDILAGTAHKSLLGPSGVGFLYIRNCDQVETFSEGGSGHNSISKRHPMVMPAKFEAGTLNYLGIIGLNASLKYIQKKGVKNIFSHEMGLTKKLINALSILKGVTVYGSLDLKHKIPVVAFNINKIPSSEVAWQLDQDYSIMVRSGLQCAPLIHKTLGTVPCGTVRVSLGFCNSAQEIDIVVKAIQTIISNN